MLVLDHFSFRCALFFCALSFSPLLIMLIIYAILIAVCSDAVVDALYTNFEFLISGCLFNHIHFGVYSIHAYARVCTCSAYVYCVSLPATQIHLNEVAMVEFAFSNPLALSPPVHHRTQTPIPSS